MKMNIQNKFRSLLVGFGLLAVVANCQYFNPGPKADNNLLLAALLLQPAAPEFSVSIVGRIRIPATAPADPIEWRVGGTGVSNRFDRFGTTGDQRRYASARRMLLTDQAGNQNILNTEAISQITSGADARGNFSMSFRVRSLTSPLRIQGLQLPDSVTTADLNITGGNSTVGDDSTRYTQESGVITFNLNINLADSTNLNQVASLATTGTDFVGDITQIRTFQVGTYNLPNPTRGEQVCDGAGVTAAPVTVSGDITGNQTWSGARLLRGTVNVQAGVVITVQPGTVIFGERGSSIFFLRDGDNVSRLVANGTAADPICWTSASRPGSRFPGDWGGIVTIGNSGASRTSLTEGPTPRAYGGVPGTNIENIRMRFNIVEFGGNEVAPGDELNNLSIYASRSDLENVQTHRGLDDQFEAWGGNLTWNQLLATGGLDDDYDLDETTGGTLRNLISHKYPAACGGTPSGDPHAFEMDGVHAGISSCSLSNLGGRCTDVTVENFTLIGASITSGEAMRLREGFAGTVRNGYVWNFVGNGTDILRDANATGAFPANAMTLTDIALPSSTPNGIALSGSTRTNLLTNLTALPIRSAGATAGDTCGFGAEKPDYRLATTAPTGFTGGATTDWYSGWTVYRAR